MEYKIEYLTDKKPHIEARIMKVAEGVRLIYCDFYERLYYDAHSSGKEEGWETIFFGDRDDTLIALDYKIEKDSIFFGEMSKKTFHGFLLDYELYCKLMEGENDS